METKITVVVAALALLGGVFVLQQDASSQLAGVGAASSQGAAHGNAGGNSSSAKGTSSNANSANSKGGSANTNASANTTATDTSANAKNTHVTVKNGLPTLDDGSVAVWELKTTTPFTTIPDDIASQLFE